MFWGKPGGQRRATLLNIKCSTRGRIETHCNFAGKSYYDCFRPNDFHNDMKPTSPPRFSHVSWIPFYVLRLDTSGSASCWVRMPTEAMRAARDAVQIGDLSCTVKGGELFYVFFLYFWNFDRFLSALISKLCCLSFSTQNHAESCRNYLKKSVLDPKRAKLD